MPLPLLVPIALGALGLFGAGKAVKAAIDTSEANDIGRSAQDIAAKAEESLNGRRDECNNALRGYGEMKIQALQLEIANFVELFGQIKNVQLAHSAEFERLKVGDFTEVTLGDLRHSCAFAAELATSTAAGVGAGAITAFGAYSGTMMLASAGTGTAISTLGGVAATNATLAWLGGGTLAAGGLGVAGGTMVLGVLVAGPALLVLGSVFGAQASKKLDEAKANMEKAKTYVTEVSLVIGKLKAIIAVSETAAHLLTNLRSRMVRSNDDLRAVLSNAGSDYSTYDSTQRDTVFKAVKFAQLVKKLIDTPVLTETGELVDSAMTSFQAIRSSLEEAPAKEMA
ncbi:hypothetical protein [Azospirillum sp. TSH64]|uniref:hypothetical protein n=1 Tax=Azospirillum sp. TSH64 TaxID=652740 RepID=UPI000D617A48|nr:hypothetical protein [Azospirillum sp. TSH64]PWC75981.1 hypothetical protein TSH64_14600 [Azospirillum sp. TSH64]